jgi:hypothetical protein
MAPFPVSFLMERHPAPWGFSEEGADHSRCKPPQQNKAKEPFKNYLAHLQPNISQMNNVA